MSENEIMKYVNEILNTSVMTSYDEALQKFVRFIFTNEFKQAHFTLPIKKRNRDSYKFLCAYIKLIHSLFKLKKEDRAALYLTNPDLIKFEIGTFIKNLIKIIKTKDDIIKEMSNDKKNQLSIIKTYLFKLACIQEKTLFSLIDLFHFYFILFISSPSALKLILFSIFKDNFQDVLAKFDYKDFCPDLEDEICQNLIILFFDNVQKEKKEYLFIFATLIFNFKEIFRDTNYQSINKYYLQEAAKKTLETVNNKTLKNELISEYIYNEFLYNLDRIIFLINESKKISNLSKIVDVIKEDKNNNSELKPLSHNNNQQLQNNTLNQLGNNQIEDKNIEDEKTIPNNKKNNYLKMKEDDNKIKEINQIKIPFSSINEENKNIKEISDENKTDIIINNSELSNNIEISNKKIMEGNSVSGNSIISQKEKNKEDLMNLSKEKIDNMDIHSLYFLFISKFNEQEKKYNEQEKKYNEQEKKFKEELFKLKEKLSKLNEENSKQKEENDKKFYDLQNDIKYLKNIVGSIQIRSFAKNFLNIFEKHLTQIEKEEIRNDNTKKGELILGAMRRKYKAHINNENFIIISEIVKKSGQTLNEGNRNAHSLELKDYEKEIKLFKEKFNIALVNNESMEKILFLMKIGIPDDTFKKCYNFVEKYCSKRMNEAILRGDSIDSFIASSKK